MSKPFVWDHGHESWPKFVEHIGINERCLGNLIPLITARFRNQTKFKEMEYFFAK